MPRIDRPDPTAGDALADGKAALRRAMADRRISAEQLAQEGRAIADQVIALPAFAAARVVGLFLSIDQEPPTAPLIEACRAAGKRVCVPARRPGGSGYAMAWLEPNDELTTGRYGVLEPATLRWADASCIDLMLVPGVAFDPRGNRLGHGKGIYDRLLGDGRALRVGLALSPRLVPEVPAGPRDMPMDLVVTPDGVHRRSGSDTTYNRETHTRITTMPAEARRPRPAGENT